MNENKVYTCLTMPTMAEINKMKKRYTAISFFAGCGGSSTGHKLAGFKMLYANEFDVEAQRTYAANHPGTIVDGRSIREVTAKDILKQIGMKTGELDLMDGSPPCTSFSTAGSRSESWGGKKANRTDDLFYEFSRIIKGVMPKTFVAENVKGLVEGDAKGYFLEILQTLKDCGYNVRAQLLNAAYLGVPQARERIIFIGVRKDLKTEPVFPLPREHALTIREVLPHIAYFKTKRNKIITYLPSTVPSPTILAIDGETAESGQMSSGGFCETFTGERRKYTIDELKLIFSFPRDFILTGSFRQQWKRCGNSVPPLMMYAVSKTVCESALDPYYKKLKKARS